MFYIYFYSGKQRDIKSKNSLKVKALSCWLTETEWIKFHLCGGGALREQLTCVLIFPSSTLSLARSLSLPLFSLSFNLVQCSKGRYGAPRKVMCVCTRDRHTHTLLEARRLMTQRPLCTRTKHKRKGEGARRRERRDQNTLLGRKKAHVQRCVWPSLCWEPTERE